MNHEECLICGAPLEYHEQDTLMECVICHKKENSKTRAAANATPTSPFSPP